MSTFNIYTKSTNCKSCYNDEETLYPLILDEKKSKTEEIGGWQLLSRTRSISLIGLRVYKRNFSLLLKILKIFIHKRKKKQANEKSDKIVLLLLNMNPLCKISVVFSTSFPLKHNMKARINSFFLFHYHHLLFRDNKKHLPVIFTWVRTCINKKFSSRLPLLLLLFHMITKEKYE
jgi:hypothetical protein